MSNVVLLGVLARRGDPTADIATLDIVTVTALLKSIHLVGGQSGPKTRIDSSRRTSTRAGASTNTARPEPLWTTVTV